MTEDLFGKKFKLNFDPTAISGPTDGPDVSGKSKPSAAKAKKAGGGNSKSKSAAGDNFSVTELLKTVKGAISAGVPKTVTVIGEISNLSTPRSGHIYLSLKDSDSQISAAMFRSAAAKLKFQPEDGMEVLATGRIDIYEAQGKLQLYITRLEPRGAGALELAYRQLVEKLGSEGLFSSEYKKAIPKFPQCICVVTSATGAAIRDISQTLSRRWPAADVLLIPVAVQGDAAATQIANAIRLASKNRDKLGIDTLIVGRGGGSIEDLWCFNEEVVARAIFDCKIPVISGVGHEVDTSIADMVADARAATPTAAAELATPDKHQYTHRISDSANRLGYSLRRLLELSHSQLASIVRCELFRNPLGRCERYQQQLDEYSAAIKSALVQTASDGRRNTEKLAHKLSWSLGGLAKRKADQLSSVELKLAGLHPRAEIKSARDKLSELTRRKSSANMRVLENKRATLAKAESLLEALSYRKVLARGYSVTRNDNGIIITSPDQLAGGDRLITELAKGEIVSRVDNPDEQLTTLQPKPTTAPKPKAGTKKSRKKADDTNLPGLFD